MNLFESEIRVLLLILATACKTVFLKRATRRRREDLAYEACCHGGQKLRCEKTSKLASTSFPFFSHH